MAWRFEPGEKLQSAFRRVATEEIAKVRAGLLGDADGHARAVHEARQGFKRLRAMARLARHALGKDFEAENARWRDVGKLLSGLRDQHVLMESFEKAVAGCGDTLPADAAEYLRQRLRAETAPPDADGKDKEAEVLRRLEAAEADMAVLEWPRNDAALLAGLKGSQARLRRSWKRARKSVAPADLHRWRKRVKDQAAQLRLFRGVEPEALRMLRADAKEAAEYLGEEHDLWILSDSLRAQTCPAEVTAARDALIDAIETRRDELRTKAFALGEKFSSQDAKAFAEAVCSAWAKGPASKKSRRKKVRPAKAPVTSQPK
jgi:CHAD domain-containing protein